jgi:hypothetical protein
MRISLTNSVGESRRAESAPSGTSKVTVGMRSLLEMRRQGASRAFVCLSIPRCFVLQKQMALYAQRGAEAPREVLPIVSRNLKSGCGGVQPAVLAAVERRRLMALESASAAIY